jgi:hypothetical protein
MILMENMACIFMKLQAASHADLLEDTLIQGQTVTQVPMETILFIWVT